MWVKKQQLEPSMEQLIGLGLGKEYNRAVFCQPACLFVCFLTCLFNLYVEQIMKSAGLDELQEGIKIGRRNINNLRYANDNTLMAESKKKLKRAS